MSEGTSYCPHCGVRVSGGWFCETCGGRLAEDGFSEAPAAGLAAHQTSSRRSLGRKVFAAVALIACVIVAAIAALFGFSSSRSPARTGPSVPLTKARVRAIDSEIRSGTDSGVEAAIAIPPSIRLSPSTLRALAALRSVSIDLHTFHLEQATIGSAIARVSNAAGTTQTWKVTLVLDARTWKLATSIGESG